jgi:hypothetical protein
MTKKFRIWDNNQNKYRDSSGELRLSRTFETFCLGLHFQRESLDDSPWASDLEIEQFTGILDSQGKEIYENDMLFHKNEKQFVRVEFSNGAFCFFGLNIRHPEEGFVLTSEYGAEMILSGNIHENYLLS